MELNIVLCCQLFQSEFMLSSLSVVIVGLKLAFSSYRWVILPFSPKDSLAFNGQGTEFREMDSHSYSNGSASPLGFQDISTSLIYKIHGGLHPLGPLRGRENLFLLKLPTLDFFFPSSPFYFPIPVLFYFFSK